MKNFIDNVREEQAANLAGNQLKEIERNKHRSTIALFISGGSLIVAIVSLLVAILK